MSLRYAAHMKQFMEFTLPKTVKYFLIKSDKN